MRNFFSFVIFGLFHVFCSIKESIAKMFWCRYAIFYLTEKKSLLADSKSIVFNGRCKFQIQNGAKISIGKGFVCNSSELYSIDTESCSKILVREDAKLIIGDNTGMSNTVIQCWNHIEIGNNVKIGAGSMIMDTNFHSLDWKLRMDKSTDCINAAKAPVILKDNVFVGSRSMILKGVTIGENSIIAAGSVVVKDIPANCIAGGNPCVVIKQL